MRERDSRRNRWYTAAYIAFFLQLAAGMAVSVWVGLSGPKTDVLDAIVAVAERFSYFAIGVTALTYTFIEGREMWLANKLKEAFREEGIEIGREEGIEIGMELGRVKWTEEGRAEGIEEGIELGYAKAVEDFKKQNGADNDTADSEPPESSQ